MHLSLKVTERILYGQNGLHEFLEKKAERALQGDSQHRQAEAELDKREWERRNTDIVLCETCRHLESQRMEIYQANQLTDQARREKAGYLEK